MYYVLCIVYALRGTWAVSFSASFTTPITPRCGRVSCGVARFAVPSVLLWASADLPGLHSVRRERGRVPRSGSCARSDAWLPLEFRGASPSAPRGSNTLMVHGVPQCVVCLSVALPCARAHLLGVGRARRTGLVAVAGRARGALRDRE